MTVDRIPLMCSRIDGSEIYTEGHAAPCQHAGCAFQVWISDSSRSMIAVGAIPECTEHTLNELGL